MSRTSLNGWLAFVAQPTRSATSSSAYISPRSSAPAISRRVFSGRFSKLRMTSDSGPDGIGKPDSDTRRAAGPFPVARPAVTTIPSNAVPGWRAVST